MGTEANDMSFTRSEEPLRQYLLGLLPPEEQRRLEEQLLFDNELIERLLIVEQEMIDDYARGTVPPEERGRFVTHFLNPPERRKKVEIARALQKYVATERPKTQPQTVRETKPARHGLQDLVRSFLTSAWRFPVAAALLLGLAAGGWWLMFYQLPLMRGVAALKQAYPRPFEARISGFNHAPWSQTRGAQENVDTVARERAERLLLDAVAERPSAKSHHALGQFYLAQGKFDQAIDQFNEALKAGGSAQIHNDLGVALMELAKKQKEKEAGGETTHEQDNTSSLLTFGRANEHFAQALQIDSKLTEAQFNQALCLQQMGLVNQAIEAWQKYLQLDATSEWANEARHKLAELEEQKKRAANNKEQIIQDYLAAYQSGDVDRLRETFNLGYEIRGNLIITRLLDEHLQLSLEGKNTEAQQRLEWLTQAASLEAQQGDLYTQDLINLYRGISSRQRDLLLKARRLLKEASSLESEKDTEALPSYQQAQAVFIQAGSLGEASLAACHIVRIKHLLYRYQEARNETESLINFAIIHQYRRLQARIYAQLQASLHLILKEYSQALAYSNRALSLMKTLADPQLEFAIRVQQAYIYLLLGNPEQALTRSVRPFELNHLYPATPSNQWFLYNTSFFCFNELDLLFTAIACQQEALHFAHEMNNQLYQSRSYAYIGEMQSRLNNLPEAIEQIEAARKIGQSLGNTHMGQEIVEHALLRLGHLYRKQGDWEKALMLYDESLRLSEELQKDYDKLNIHRGKLLVHLARHDTEEAKAELQVVLSLFEQHVANVTQEALRNSFFDTGQDIYDLALQFASDYQHDQEQAFNYSERSRARSSLDLLKDKSSPDDSLTNDDVPISSLTTPLSLAEIRQQMPPSVQIVQYALLSDALHIWVISRESFHSITKPIRLSDLNAKITAYLDCLAQRAKAGSHEAGQLSKELYDILISSVENNLDINKELCIVPDESLNYLPFGSLIEPHSQQYLIEKYTIVYAPSATVFLACTDTAKRKVNFVPEHCLAIGNPLFDRETFPQLEDLPAAAREAERIREFYSAKPPLLAGNVSVSAFRHEAPNAEVVHIASHGLVNTQRPEYSGILLAKEANHAQPIADGFLSAGEVLHLRLPRTKLVVLSACQTWLGHNYHGEGMTGLARAFIVAGTPLVVASLWKVDSELTGELMKSFHRHRTQEGCSTTRALREAQLEMLRQPHLRSPNVWAAFITVGGHASY